MTRTPYSCQPYGEKSIQKLLTAITIKNTWKKILSWWYRDCAGAAGMSEGQFLLMYGHNNPGKKTNKDIDEASDTYDTIDWADKEYQ